MQNGNEPTIGTVTEEKESELEEYIDQAELVLGAFGYKVFEPRIISETAEEPESDIILGSKYTNS